MDRLKGKTALVTGAGTGIGAAVCRAFAREGASVAVTDVMHDHEMCEIVEEIKAIGGDAFQMRCDVFEEEQVRATIDEAIRRFGYLDILVSNAGGGGHHGTVWTETIEDFQRIVNLNLRSVWFGMKYALPHMIQRRSGRIINTASQLAHKPAPENASYSATKAAVVALSCAAALEAAEYGVTVNCVCPGPTDTPIWQSYPEEWRNWKANSLPLKRVSTPAEQAWAYVYLASDEASYMTGQSVSPNGGDVMW